MFSARAALHTPAVAGASGFLDTRDGNGVSMLRGNMTRCETVDRRAGPSTPDERGTLAAHRTADANINIY